MTISLKDASGATVSIATPEELAGDNTANPGAYTTKGWLKSVWTALGSGATAIDGATIPTGGVGIVGWLSAIWARLGSAFGAGIGSATKVVAVTPDTPFTLCRALNVQTAGVATITFEDNTTCEVYLISGWNPVSCKNVSASELTAGGIGACY